MPKIRNQKRPFWLHSITKIMKSFLLFFSLLLSLTAFCQPLSATFTGIDPTCDGNSNGTIFTAVSGGTSPYTYAWSNGKTTRNINLLAAGIYSVTITDAASSTFVGSHTLVAPPPLVATLSQPSSGTVQVNASGGTPLYEYTRTGMSGWQTNNQFSGLTVGTAYIFKVRDSKSCQKSYILKVQ